MSITSIGSSFMTFMDHYKTYSVEDFVQDLRFRSWVKNPSREEDVIWQDWISANIDKVEAIQEARAIVLSVHPINAENISDPEIENEIAGILARIDREESAVEQCAARRSISFSFWLKLAASVGIFIIAGWQAIKHLSNQVTSPDSSVALVDNYMIERVNESVDTLLISLPDNSSVLLAQHSLVRYPRQFGDNERRVFLEGTAFFEVTKNPRKPFYVDVGKIVAKVLGTSFEISTDPRDGQVRVIVKSGSVSIYSNSEQHGQDAAREPNVILTRNEQAVFRGDVNEIRHTRLDSLSINDLKVPDTFMKFEGTPAEAVFSSLARVYGVTIDFTRANISGCSVTASFTDEPFALKLDLICRSIGLDYNVANDYVTVTGNGCRN